jgi:hypothetical protein
VRIQALLSGDVRVTNIGSYVIRIAHEGGGAATAPAAFAGADSHSAGATAGGATPDGITILRRGEMEDVHVRIAAAHDIHGPR